MLLLVTHETRYDYAPPVATAQHLAHLKPLATPSQKLLRHALRIAPEPAQRSESLTASVIAPWFRTAATTDGRCFG